MFKLSRAGSNVPAEVQRWQYFLLKYGINQTGALDSHFGGNTEIGTKIYQIQNGLTAHGRADEDTLLAAQADGYTILPSDYYSDRNSLSWPERPSDINSPSNHWRNTLFDCFQFLQKPGHQRPDAEAIVIKGNCSGTISDWEDEYITNLYDDRMQFAAGYNGYVRCHKRAAPKIKELLDIWEKEDLLHLILNYAGCYVPRYKRNKAPSATAGHSKRKSKDVGELSNHSFGSAIDISTTWNWLGQTPARCGQKGSVRELVEAANSNGFFWVDISVARRTVCILNLRSSESLKNDKD